MPTFSFMRNRWLLFGAGLVLGALVILVIRFATYSVHNTHYHANFAVYLNGQREEFKGPQYYEEVAACTAHGPIQPAQRAHMHDQINSVIHVHDDGVTWEQFFNNIGWYLGPNFIQTADGTMYTENGNNKLNIMLNGQNLTDLTSIADQTIGDRDRLLISFGDISNAQLQKEYQTVPSTAKHYDETPDPASCAGQLNKVTIGDRFKHLF
ncbi:MAG TPA: hypothetical protein VFH39_01185 [Candidatus Saccharimonadales bacterium]|nr:hypothetical protein [Candidatus Saccharimonadales bacterium]